MKLTCIFSLGCMSCVNFRPPLPPTPPGTYQGYDSSLYVFGPYATRMFGECLTVEGYPDSNLSFNGKMLTPIGGNEYSFDYLDTADYGLGNRHEYHIIRRRGVFTFTYNHLIVEYGVAEVEMPESRFRFNGWR